MPRETILVTGAAGFIGMHFCRLSLERGFRVVGVDNLNDYYSVELKADRLKLLSQYPEFQFHSVDIADYASLKAVFERSQAPTVVHLAAQAGVRYGLTHPHAYGAANLTGFLNLLECCRHTSVGNLIFASSSSVYGTNKQIPFVESHPADHPVSLYAATKKANELMAHSYAHLFHLPVTGLRFFTVYGPWGRPDMAPLLFTRSILAGETIDVFNHGDMYRDFTFIDDIVESMFRLISLPPQSEQGLPPYRILNIGNHSPVKLLDFISLLEKELGVTAKKNFLPMQPGEVHTTYADVSALYELTGFKPETRFEDGVRKLVQWYREYY
jgi:UDP-glucuronate 4-epimerase